MIETQVNSTRVLIIGDIMLDRYVIADEVRTSPEADIPLIYNYNHEDRLGGAGNVAINLKGLEIEPILFSITGDDANARALESLCQMNGLQHYFLVDSSRPTTLKTRIVDSQFNQLLRMDNEETDDIEANVEHSVLEAIGSLMNEYAFEAILIQDYNKGLITETVIEYLQSISSTMEIPLLVDPKKNHFKLLTKCRLFKPNLKELSLAVGYNIKPNVSSIRHALTELEGDENAIYAITLAQHGLFYQYHDTHGIIEGYEIDNPDVSGAGDTVLAVLTYGLLHEYSVEKMAQLGNKAGALVCQKKGIQAIHLKELQM